MIGRIRTNSAAGATAAGVVDLMDDMPALVEAPESPPDSPRDGSAPASPCAATAPIKSQQPHAAAHRKPQAAPSGRGAAGPRQADSAPEPGLPLVLFDEASSTTSAQADPGGEGAPEGVGPALMDPRRRLLKDICAAWDDPTTFTSREVS